MILQVMQAFVHRRIQGSQPVRVIFPPGLGKTGALAGGMTKCAGTVVQHVRAYLFEDIYIYMYIYIYIYLCIYLFIYNRGTHPYTHMHTHMNRYSDLYIYMYIYVCIDILGSQNQEP